MVAELLRLATETLLRTAKALLLATKALRGIRTLLLVAELLRLATKALLRTAETLLLATETLLLATAKTVVLVHRI